MCDIPLNKFYFDAVFIFFMINLFYYYNLIIFKVSQFIFLILFSYMMLCNYFIVSINDTWHRITYIEIILIIWRFSYIPSILYTLYFAVNELSNMVVYNRKLFFDLQNKSEIHFFEFLYDRVLFISKRLTLRGFLFYSMQVIL
jgi:hypothetical protein